MKFPCEIIQVEYIPLVRKVIVHELKRKGWTQTQIAEMIGISQPLISQYLKTRPKEHDAENVIAQTAIQTGKEAARLIQKTATITEAMMLVCDQCKNLRNLGPICSLHFKQIPELQQVTPYCNVCHDERGEGKTAIDKKYVVLHEFKDWLQKTLRLPRISSLIPEIGLQIAYDPLNAQSITEVISIPGRIIKVRLTPVMVSEPEYGGSVTLPELLLWYKREIAKKVQVVVSFKLNKTSKTFLDSLQLSYMITEGIDIQPDEVKKQIKAESKRKRVKLVIDKGSVGFESLAYYFGDSLHEVYEFLALL